MSLTCVGCNQTFSSGEAYDLHATGSRRAPASAKRRCRTVDEMRALGMVQVPGNHAWRLSNRNDKRHDRR